MPEESGLAGCKFGAPSLEHLVGGSSLKYGKA